MHSVMCPHYTRTLIQFKTHSEQSLETEKKNTQISIKPSASGYVSEHETPCETSLSHTCLKLMMRVQGSCILQARHPWFMFHQFAETSGYQR